MTVSLLKPPHGGSEVKRPLHGGFGSQTAKNLTVIYLTDIPQRTQVPVRVYGNVTAVVADQRSKPTALFWCQNVYRELSQLPLPSKAVKCY
jgi:hypothetical protein